MVGATLDYYKYPKVLKWVEDQIACQRNSDSEEATCRISAEDIVLRLEAHIMQGLVTTIASGVTAGKGFRTVNGEELRIASAENAGDTRRVIKETFGSQFVLAECARLWRTHNQMYSPVRVSSPTGPSTWRGTWEPSFCLRLSL